MPSFVSGKLAQIRSSAITSNHRISDQKGNYQFAINVVEKSRNSCINYGKISPNYSIIAQTCI